MKYAILMLLAASAFGQAATIQMSNRAGGVQPVLICESPDGTWIKAHHCKITEGHNLDEVVGSLAAMIPASAPKPKGKAAIITACTACTSSSLTTITTATPPECAAIFGKGWTAGKGGVCYSNLIAEPIDVPAIQEVNDCPGIKMENPPPCGPKHAWWTCKDKTRALLVSVDGKRHACHRLEVGRPDPEQGDKK